MRVRKGTDKTTGEKAHSRRLLSSINLVLSIVSLHLIFFVATTFAKSPHRSQRAEELIELGQSKISENKSEAIRLLKEGCKLARQDENLEQMLECLQDLLVFYLDNGKLDSAERLAQDFLSLSQNKGERRFEAWALDFIGNVLFYRADYKGALQKFQESAALMSESNDIIGESVALKDVGITLKYLNRYDDALETLYRSLELCRQTNNKTGMMSSLINIGSGYMHFGYTRQALQTLQQVLSLARETNNENEMYNALIRMGFLYLDLNSPIQAIELFRQALDIAEKINAVPSQRAWILSGISLANYKLGNIDEAIRIQHEAFEINRRFGGIEFIAAHYRDFGQLYIKRDPQLAIDYYNRAISYMQRINSPRFRYAYSGIAQAYLQQNNFDKAIEYYEKAIEEVESIRSLFGSEQRRASFSGNHQFIYQGLIEALLKRAESSANSSNDKARAYETFERAKARTLLEAITTMRLDLEQELSPELRERHKSLSERIANLQKRLMQTIASKEERQQILKELEQTEKEFELLLVEIKNHNPRYVATVYPQPLTLEQAQNELDDETALLAYSVMRESVLVFVLTKTDFHIERLSVTPDALTTRVQNYVDLLSVSNDESWQAISNRLQTEIIEPVLKHIKPNAKKLVIVPDGTLHYLPFETLLSANNPRFLIEDFEISYAPSATVYAQLKVSKQTKANEGALIFAAPSLSPNLFTSSTAQRPNEIMRSLFEIENWQINSIPSSANEAEIVAQLAGSTSQIYKEKEASEKRLKATQLERYKILHFATHGLVSQEIPERSSLLLSTEGDRDTEDGLLQAHEIYQLKLSSDLVVLSACQTAHGQILKGEGIKGLAQAFFYAGARSVVASLWNVNDERTTEFMRAFYKNLNEGKSKATALREAKLEIIRYDKQTQPRYWAAFILLGEANDPIALPQGLSNSRRWIWVLVIAVGISICVATFFIFRRRTIKGRNTTVRECV